MAADRPTARRGSARRGALPLRSRDLTAAAAREHVTPRELFFDLVFVFAFTQVTALLAADPTFGGIGRGVLVLAVLWWAWAAYAWLTSSVDPEETLVGVAMLVAMIATFVVALAVPGAFGDDGVLFGAAFLVVCATHLALYVSAAGTDTDLVAAVLRLAPSTLLGAALILVAGFADEARPWIWLVALAIVYGGAALSGPTGWHLHPSHFAERHRLVIILALGEAFIAFGIGATGIAIGPGEVLVAILGILVAASFWLAYFDFFGIRGEQLLRDLDGAERVATERDTYTYAHFPMIVGIVLFAFAMKTIVADVGDDLEPAVAFALCGGSALYLLAYSVIQTRLKRRPALSRDRFLAALMLVLLLPIATMVPALAALTLITAVWLALHTHELVCSRRRATSRLSSSDGLEPSTR